jgi:hypothetical protein
VLIEKRDRSAEQGQSGTVIVMNGHPRELPSSIASRLSDGRNRIVHNADPDIRPALTR